FKSTLSWLCSVQPVTAAVTTPASSVVANPALFPKRPPVEDNASAGIEPPTFPVDGITVAQAGCKHFIDALTGGGANHNQGLWMQTVLAATFCENGRRLAHKMSYAHPGYTKEDTDAMFDRKVADRDAKGLGWPSCQTFANNGCKLCSSCVHNGKVRSPLNLGKQIRPPPPAAFATVQAAASVASLHLPQGYGMAYYDLLKTDLVGFTRMRRIKGEEPEPEFVPLFLCKIDAAWAQREPHAAINFIAYTSQGHKVDVSIPTEVFASPQALATAMGKQFVNINSREKEELCVFMGFWLQKMHAEAEAAEAVPFGWWLLNGKKHGFAYGTHIYKEDGTMSKAGRGDFKLKGHYLPRGDIQLWRDALKLVTSQHRPCIEVITAASFASPLLAFTNQYSGVLVGHNDSGGNKSTECDVGAAVWGNPKMTKETAATSALGLLNKMGEIRNLPMYWDDVSTDELLDRATSVAHEATMGRGGQKCNPDGTLRTVQEWQALLIVCSN